MSLKKSLPFFLIFLLFGLITAGNAPFYGSSEAREAHVIFDIVTGGDWVSGDRNGLPASKPPLSHWIGASLSLVTGLEVNEFVARFPSIVSASLIVLLFAWLGIAFEASLTPVVLVLMYGFMSLAYDARVDMTFAACITAATFMLLKPVISQEASLTLSTRELLLAIIFTTLSILAKGPAGVIAVFLLGGVPLILKYGLKEILVWAFDRRRIWLIAISPFCFCSWYFILYLNGEYDLLERQLGFENFERFFGGKHTNGEPFYYYLESLVTKIFPWGVIFLIILWKERLSREPRAVIRRNLGVGILALLLFYSFAEGKRHSYLLPAYPWIAFITGSYFSTPEWLSKASKGVFFLILGYGITFPIVLNIGGPYTEKVLTAYGPNSLLVLLVALIVGYFVRKKEPLLFFTLASAAFFSGFSLGDAVKADLKGFFYISEEINSEVAQTESLGAYRSLYDERLDPVLYYLKRPVSLYLQEDGASPDCNGKESTYLIIKKSDYVSGEIVRELTENFVSKPDKNILLVRCK